MARLGMALEEMCLFAAQAMRDATTALLTADLALAEQVIARDAELDARRARCQERAQALLASPAPGAPQLRLVRAIGYCADTVERMGDLAARIAETVRSQQPRPAAPAVLLDRFGRLGELTAAMADRLTALLADPVDGMSAELDSADSAVDDLHDEILGLITASNWGENPADALAVALLARFYQRFGDQVVSVARHIELTTTGTPPR
ncbi:phosphate transport system regulatory protein PhoU [Amycolatopsis sp. FDAARGOS 1241]|nr:phosphate transport system regulatory protein PhoU [Amycolatopsis sp. FDAARGOS 1241]